MFNCMYNKFPHYNYALEMCTTLCPINDYNLLIFNYYN